jgi:hypothetical protein
VIVNNSRPPGPWMSWPLAVMIALAALTIVLLTHGFGVL